MKDRNEDSAPLLRRRDVAALLRTSEATVIRLEQAGKLRPIRIGPTGRAVRFTAEDVERLVEAGRGAA